MHSIFKAIKIVFFVFVTLALANFAINNLEPIVVDLGPFANHISIQLYLFTFIVFTLGMLTASFHFMIELLKKSFAIWRQKKEISKLKHVKEDSVKKDPKINASIVNDDKKKKDSEHHKIDI